MSSEINGNVPDARFWLSRKFWLTVLGAIVFLVLALSGTVRFTNTEAIVVILGLIGINAGAHTLTDLTSMIVGRQRVTSPDKPRRIDDGSMPAFNPSIPIPAVRISPNMPETRDETIETPSIQDTRGRT